MKQNGVLGGLRETRLVAGLRLDKAAKVLGITKGELSRYERAERRLPSRLVAPLAAAYGTTVTQVLAANERDWMAREAAAPEPPAEATR